MGTEALQPGADAFLSQIQQAQQGLNDPGKSTTAKSTMFGGRKVVVGGKERSMAELYKHVTNLGGEDLKQIEQVMAKLQELDVGLSTALKDKKKLSKEKEDGVTSRAGTKAKRAAEDYVAKLKATCSPRQGKNSEDVQMQSSISFETKGSLNKVGVPDWLKECVQGDLTEQQYVNFVVYLESNSLPPQNYTKEGMTWVIKQYNTAQDQTASRLPEHEFASRSKILDCKIQIKSELNAAKELQLKRSSSETTGSLNKVDVPDWLKECVQGDLTEDQYKSFVVYLKSIKLGRDSDEPLSPEYLTKEGIKHIISLYNAEQEEHIKEWEADPRQRQRHLNRKIQVKNE